MCISRCSGPSGRVRVRSGERGYDVHPPQEAEHLDETGEDPDRRRQRNDALEPEDLSEQHGPGDQQESRQHERPPQEDQARAALPEALEDLGRGSSQDVRVLEALAEQGEVRVEPERRRDEHHVRRRSRRSRTRASSRFPDFGSRSEQACEEEPGQESEDERSARAEDREPLIDVPRDHVRAHDPAKRPGRWVRNGPPHRTRESDLVRAPAPASSPPRDRSPHP